jgi:hypothetical protein
MQLQEMVARIVPLIMEEFAIRRVAKNVTAEVSPPVNLQSAGRPKINSKLGRFRKDRI